MTDNIYQPANVALFEAIYGKNLISLGGVAAIDNMFSDIDLNKIKKVVDIGFGLGGVAFYLAEKYLFEISGIEIHPWMAEYATSHAPTKIVHKLQFMVYNQAGEIPLPLTEFDLAYSKGVFNHVQNKEKLLGKIHQLLKPQGLLVIADWIYPEVSIADENGLIHETKSSYEAVLNKAGFQNIEFRNDSEQFSIYVKDLLHNITIRQKYIEDNFGTTIFSTIKNDHQKLLSELQKKQKFAIGITAKNY
jgi:ubiquinone/menaquinone biosynthesis C-methylase UbiE